VTIAVPHFEQYRAIKILLRLEYSMNPEWNFPADALQQVQTTYGLSRQLPAFDIRRAVKAC
jgi:hypothetical protein